MVSLLTLFSLKFKISGTASAGLLISTVGKAASPSRRISGRLPALADQNSISRKWDRKNVKEYQVSCARGKRP